MRRLLVGAALLAAVAADVAAVPSVVPPNRALNFSRGGFFEDSGNAGAVIVIPDGMEGSGSKDFGWEANSTVSVSAVGLFVHLEDGKDTLLAEGQAGGGAATGPQSSIRPTVPSSSTASQDAPKGKSSGVSIHVSRNGTGGEVTIDSLQSLSPYVGGALYFRANWTAPTASTGSMGAHAGAGESYSMKFTVTTGQGEVSALAGEYASDAPFSEEVEPDSGPTDSPTSTAASTTASVGATTSSSPSGGSSPTSSRSHGGGLSTGAIAGIAVACGLVGLGLLGFLVWLLWFRRRRTDAAQLPYASDRHQRTQDLVAEKEATAGVSEAPHSPYSDDSGHGAAPLADDRGPAHVPVANVSPSQHEQAHGPYAGHPAGPPPGAVPEASEHVSLRHDDRGGQTGDLDDGAGSAGNSVAPQNGPSRYSHLVEEGMTEEEIRRLEEEERQLDAAIEEAGRR